MKYLHILLSCAAEPLAIEPEKLESIMQFLKFKADGGELSAEEIQAAVSNKKEAEVSASSGNVGVIPIYGLLAQRSFDLNLSEQGVSTIAVSRVFRSMVADDQTKAIVLDIHSPGGTVFGIQELADDIYSARGLKPIIAQVNSLASSAAYWIASQADEVVVTPGGRAGSIGVYSVHEDISKFLESKGVKRTVISSHPNKTMASEHEPLSDEAKSIIQQRVDESSATFVESVARGRGVTPAKVNEKFGNGLVFSGKELLSRGMADRIGTLDDTLERFGASVRPQAMRKKAPVARTDDPAVALLIEKLSTGDQLTRRELEHGLKGLAGLSNSEAERAVRECFKAIGPGEPDLSAQTAAKRKAISELKAKLDSFDTSFGL